jgi:PAB1-binding protein PBP1
VSSGLYSSNFHRSSPSCSGFRTDTDISSNNASGNPKERELQQWQSEPSSTTAANLAALQGDEATFGVPGVYSAIPWDQFEVNERLFGVNPKFDEEAYTTKLDRSAPGYKEKERKAEQIANEIISVCRLASLHLFLC